RTVGGASPSRPSQRENPARLRGRGETHPVGGARPGSPPRDGGRGKECLAGSRENAAGPQQGRSCSGQPGRIGAFASAPSALQNQLASVPPHCFSAALGKPRPLGRIGPCPCPKWCGEEGDWWWRKCQQRHQLALDDRIVVIRIWQTEDP